MKVQDYMCTAKRLEVLYYYYYNYYPCVRIPNLKVKSKFYVNWNVFMLAQNALRCLLWAKK